MKIALITDQHLDGRKGSLPFWNYWQKFYDEIFFPTLEREGITTVFDLGDTFDKDYLGIGYFLLLIYDENDQTKHDHNL